MMKRLLWLGAALVAFFGLAGVVPDGRLDFAALGYDPEKAQALASLAAPTPTELPTTGAGLVALPLLLAGGLLALGGGLLWKRRR